MERKFDRSITAVKFEELLVRPVGTSLANIAISGVSYHQAWDCFGICLFIDWEQT